MSVAAVVYGDVLDAQKHRIAGTKRAVRPTSAASSSTASTSKRRRTRAPAQPPAAPVHTFTERIAPDLLRELETQLPAETRDGSDLRRYAATLDAHGAKQVHYAPQQHGVGRLYAHDGVSLVQLTRSVRRLLCEPSMLDIDVVNAHPSMLLQLAERNDWPCAALREYVDDRDTVLASIDVERAKAKRLVLKLLFGGAPGEYAAQRFVRRLYGELRSIRASVWREQSELRAIIESLGRTHSKASCLSFLLMQNERAVLDAVVEQLTGAGWTVAALAYDGLMVYRRDDCEQPDFAALAAHVHERTGFRLDFCVKPWGESNAE